MDTLIAFPSTFLFTLNSSICTGHLNMVRFTVQDREDQKKREKELLRTAPKTTDEEVDRSGWAKYTLGLKHQVCEKNSQQLTMCPKLDLV